MWEREESLPEEIRKAWQDGLTKTNLADVSHKIGSVMGALQRWSRDMFGSVTEELASIRKQIEEINLADPISNEEALNRLMARMDELLYREEMMWLQRWRINWLREDDWNTKYFHRQAAWRAKKNKIKKLKTSDGQLTENKIVMENMATRFFKQLCTKDDNVVPETLLNLVQPKITQEINDDLCKEFSSQEIADALFQIGPLKAPGPDAFPDRFFQRNWEVIKQDIVGAVKEIFSTGCMPEGVNEQ